MGIIVDDISRMVATVKKDEAHIYVLSTGEYLAVALVLDRHDLIKQSNYPTMLEAASRLGAEWLEASLSVQRSIR